jgi:hypothetical protein
MAFNLSVNAIAKANQISKTPQIVLEIEGLDVIFGTSPVYEFARWDKSVLWDSETTWDGLTPKPESRDYISWKGTTKNITQQLRPDKSNTSSISTMMIDLIDKNGEVSEAFSFDNVTDMLGKRCNVYLTFEGLAYPEDAIPIFKGFVDDYIDEAGKVMLSVSSPENLKRQTLFTQYTDILNGSIDDTQTTINVFDTTDIIESQDALTTFIRVEDEIMEVISSTNTTLEVIRSRLNTLAVAHDDESDLLSFYKLGGSPIDLSLKLMLSDDEGNVFYDSDEQIKSINILNNTETLTNTLIFERPDIESITGLVPGDAIRLDGVVAGDYTIQSFGLTEVGGSTITLVEDIANLDDSSMILFSWKSQYNVLSEGCGMLPDEVDVEQFESIRTLFGTNFIDYELYIKETVDEAKKLIDEKILFPQGLYSVPRKARSSVKFTAPPLSSEFTPLLNSSTVTNMEKLKQRRSTHKFLYNQVNYLFNEDRLEDKFLDQTRRISDDSRKRIRRGKQPLIIEAGGIRRSSQTTQVIDRLTTRFLDRYKYAAKYIQKVELLYKDGFAIEIGDTVVFGGKDTQLTDLQTGEKNLPLKLYEVSNKSLNIEGGKVSLDIIESGFALDARFGVISPASNIDANSTAIRIILKKTLDVGDVINERDKYADYIGTQIRVRSQDYTFDETVTLESFDSLNNNAINISALSQAPLEDYIFELPLYDNISINEKGDLEKIKYTWLMASKEITVSDTASSFDVADTDALEIGFAVLVHSPDYTNDSIETTVTDIQGNTITLEDALSFTPQIGDKMQVLTSPDGEFGYRYL